MSKLWHELENLHIPVGRVIVIVSVVLTAYVWADNLGDAQITTQKQLDQLVKITTENVAENKKVHEAQNENLKVQGESLAVVEKSFALLVQEIKLRRELESNRTATPPPVE